MVTKGLSDFPPLHSDVVLIEFLALMADFRHRISCHTQKDFLFFFFYITEVSVPQAKARRCLCSGARIARVKRK